MVAALPKKRAGSRLAYRTPLSPPASSDPANNKFWPPSVAGGDQDLPSDEHREAKFDTNVRIWRKRRVQDAEWRCGRSGRLHAAEAVHRARDALRANGQFAQA